MMKVFVAKLGKCNYDSSNSQGKLCIYGSFTQYILIVPNIYVCHFSCNLSSKAAEVLRPANLN